MALTPRAGFVALIGRPNVGKSTLLNLLLGQKIAIASPKPQTTRNRILGVKNLPSEAAQLVLVDTPGLHRPSGKGRSRLNQFMMGEALAALEEVDAVVLIVECPELKDKKPLRFEQDIGCRVVLEELKGQEKPIILAINKVDLLHNKRQLLPFIDGYHQLNRFAAVVPISAQTSDGVAELEREMVKLLPESPPLYPEEMLTDRAERWLAAEFVREQVFLLTRQEIPYSVAVTIDEWQERPARDAHPADVVVSATVHVEKEPQKRIVVGEAGRMVREIGSRARHEIGKLLGCPVHLTLFVRVDEKWSEDPTAMQEFGYERK